MAAPDLAAAVSFAETCGGDRDQLLGKLQQRYGLLKADAEVQLDKWLAKVGAARGEAESKQTDAPKAAGSPPEEG